MEFNTSTVCGCDTPNTQEPQLSQSDNVLFVEQTPEMNKNPSATSDLRHAADSSNRIVTSRLCELFANNSKHNTTINSTTLHTKGYLHPNADVKDGQMGWACGTCGGEKTGF